MFLTFLVFAPSSANNNSAALNHWMHWKSLRPKAALKNLLNWYIWISKYIINGCYWGRAAISTATYDCFASTDGINNSSNISVFEKLCALKVWEEPFCLFLSLSIFSLSPAHLNLSALTCSCAFNLRFTNTVCLCHWNSLNLGLLEIFSQDVPNRF